MTKITTKFQTSEPNKEASIEAIRDGEEASQYPDKHSAGDVSAKIFPDISALGEQSVRGFKMQMIVLKLHEDVGLRGI